jgi:hypothetical protein
MQGGDQRICAPARGGLRRPVGAGRVAQRNADDGAGRHVRTAVRGAAWRTGGDVELHLRTDGWTAHGHDQDPRYNGVVLHVVVTPPRTATGVEVALAGGGRAPTLRLDAIGARAGEGSRQGWPCEGAAGRLGLRALRALLREAGAHRFARRAAALAGELCAALPAEEKEETVGLRWTPEDRVLSTTTA